MSNITFENLSAQIAAGTLTAEDILNYDCHALSNNEKLALLVSLGEKLVDDGTANSLASVQSGIEVGSGGTVVVPNFLTGRIQFIDTSGTANNTLTGSHQFVTDTEGDSYPENSIMEFGGVSGKYYNGRTFTVPVGVTMLYTFVLDA